MLMPDELLRPPDRTLGEIAVGETVFTRATALVVTSDKQGYLIPSQTEFSTEPEDFALRVHRDEKGYNVAVRDERTWVPATEPVLSAGWIPVASITTGFGGHAGGVGPVKPTPIGAKLPESMVQKPEPRLRDLPLGVEVFSECSNLEVTADRSCYLRPTGKYESKPNILFNLRVSRDDAGYHLAILSDLITWKPDTPDSMVVDWIPVVSTVVDLDPALIRYSKK